MSSFGCTAAVTNTITITASFLWQSNNAHIHLLWNSKFKHLAAIICLNPGSCWIRSTLQQKLKWECNHTRLICASSIIINTGLLIGRHTALFLCGFPDIRPVFLSVTCTGFTNNYSLQGDSIKPGQDTPQFVTDFRFTAPSVWPQISDTKHAIIKQQTVNNRRQKFQVSIE